MKVEPLLPTAPPTYTGLWSQGWSWVGIFFYPQLHNPAPTPTTDNWLTHWLPALHWPYDHWLSRIVSQSVEAYSGEWINLCCLYSSYLLLVWPSCTPTVRLHMSICTQNKMIYLPLNSRLSSYFPQGKSLTLPASSTPTPLSPFLTFPPLLQFHITTCMERGYCVKSLE